MQYLRKYLFFTFAIRNTVQLISIFPQRRRRPFLYSYTP